jgi:hypothetical protein
MNFEEFTNIHGFGEAKAAGRGRTGSSGKLAHLHHKLVSSL